MMLDEKSTSTHSKSHRTFRCPPIPFYLKAILLTCASAASYMILRGNRFGESTLSESNSDPAVLLGNTVTGVLPTYLVVNSASFSPVSIPGSVSLISLEDTSAATSQKPEKAERSEESNKMSDFLVQHHLLQASVQMGQELEPVIVDPIRDQFVQMGETYTYDVSRVFSGDYFMIRASGLPGWLNVKYKQLGSYLAGNSSAQSVAASGNTVFVANREAGLQILDVSDLKRPQLLSTYPSGSGSASGVAVSDNTVFVANYNAGLQILDVSDLRHPQLLSTYPAGGGLAYGVAVSGNTVFVADGSAGLQILDASDLRHPQLLSTYPADKNLILNVAILGNTVFVANWQRGLQILDVSNLTHPQLLSTVPASRGSAAQGVAVSSNTVFVADIIELQILDVSDLRHPQLLSTYPAGSGGSTYGVAVFGNTVFVADEQAGLQILDVSDPVHPQLLSTHPAGSGYARGVAVVSNTVFVANGQAGLQILGLHSATLTGTPLAAEVKIGQKWMINIIAYGLNDALITHTFNLTVDDLPQLVKNTLTDQSMFPGELLILPIKSEQLFSAPTTSSLRFSLHHSDNTILPDWLAFSPSPQLLSIYPVGSGVVKVVVSGNTVFVSDFGVGLQILNVSDVKHPQLLSTYPGGSWARSMVVSESGNIVSVANDLAGLLILNVSNLTHPQLLSTYPVAKGSASWDVAVSGKTVFVANGKAGLVILDVSDLVHPKLLSTYPAGSGAAAGVAVSGNTVFLANGYTGLQILDVSDLRHPQLLSVVPAGKSGSAQGVLISGKTVFVANWEAGLQILDVSDLRHPQLLSTYPSGGGLAYRVAVSGNMVFVADGRAGLQILDVGNLTYPQLLCSYLTNKGDGALDVTISNNTVFVANNKAGLYILSTSNWQLKISANPAVADAGNYYLVLTATDEVGASVSIPFTLRVEGPPRVNAPVASQYAEIARLFTFNLPPETFTDPNFDPLIFDLSYVNQTGLPSWLQFNKLSVTLSGTPSIQDRGIVRLRFTAKDPRGQANYTDFNLIVVYAPKTISDQPLSLVQKRFFNRTILLETVFDESCQPFNYSIISDSESAVLPEWLNYSLVGTNLTLLGLPITLGTVTLFVLAQTSLGYRASTPFVLSVSPNAPPQVKQAISAQTATVGQGFDFVLPVNTFEDTHGDTLRYTASLAEGTVLPNWLTFVADEKGVWHFKGTPGGWDTNPFSARTLTIQITAHNMEDNSAITLFNLTVNGTSTLGLLLKIATPLLSAFGLFQKRSVALNRLCYKRRQKLPQTLEAGQPFRLSLSTPSETVGSIEVKTRHIPSKGCTRFLDCQRFFKPPIHYLQLPYDALPDGLALPKWMEYRKSKNRLEGILPLNVDFRELIVFVKNRAGVIQEHFTLKIEGADLDLEENNQPVLTHFKSSRRSTYPFNIRENRGGVNIQDDPDSDMYSRTVNH